MVEGGPIDVLTGDWLAELTMLILARTAAKKPGAGYARTFVGQMEQVMGTCLERGIKVVSNAGGLHPDGASEAVAEVAHKLGLHPKIAYVNGDDLLPRLEELVASGVDLAHFESGEPLEDLDSFISANAYLGCWGIVEALAGGADIVITGRVTDAAVVCGPAAWHHGWQRNDWDALAGAVVAGHLIECGPQVTGGNYSFFHEIANMARPGFPWAEIAADGSSVIGKHDHTDGEVSIGTVTSQLLYEIAGPRYYGPDVTARFDTVELAEVGPDRVQVSGTLGEPPPDTLKVAMNRLGGYRQNLSIALTGLDIEAKADLAAETFWELCPYAPEEIESVTTQLIRTDHEDPETNEAATAELRIVVRDPDERKVGRAVASAMTGTALGSIPGMYGMSGMPGPGHAYGVYRPAKVPASLVPSQVVVLGGERTEITSVAPTAKTPDITAPVGPQAPVPDGDTTVAPLGAVVGARSGDKGGNANLGVFTRDDAAWAWLDQFLTVERLRELLPETSEMVIDRHRFPVVRSLNFVVHGLLDEGVAASTRRDAQAKSLGEWLRARHVDIPVTLLR